MSEAAPAAATERRGPRWGTIALAGLGLTFVFMVLRFPYEELGARIADAVERDSGVRLQLGEISLGLVAWGPAIEAEGVRVQMPSGSLVDLDRVGLRPALSLSWLRGRPAVATEAHGAAGRVSGVVTLGAGGGFRGRFEEVVLGQLPPELLKGPIALDGVADADVDLVGGERGSEGRVVFRAREGVIQHPDLPLPMPYESLDAEIELGGESLARIERMELASPLARGRATGTIGFADRFEQAPLDLDIELTVSGAVRGSLNAQGVKVGRDGQLRLSVMGTPARPIVR